MKIISPTQHGYLDYLTVTLFLFAPIIGLTGAAGALCYIFAGIHLAMTLATDFPLGSAKWIPYSVHGWVERVVGPVLILLPFVLGFDIAARSFYILLGIIIIVVGLLTDYKRTE